MGLAQCIRFFLREGTVIATTFTCLARMCSKPSRVSGPPRALRKSRFMVLYSLLAMCERHDVNPESYLVDVLIRIQDQPKDKVADLLPHRWKETTGSAFTVERIASPRDGP